MKVQKSETPTKATGSSETKVLDALSIDLTQMAREGRVDSLRGRDAEIKRLGLILSRRKKSNPVLIGEPGVGKTAIIEGLACKIAAGDVEERLLDKRLILLDMPMIIASDSPVKTLRVVLNELEANPHIIAFVDEIHIIVGAAQNGAMDLANVMKPALARGGIHLIGATTLKEYKATIEKDGALSRRFLPIMVNEPSASETIEILMHAKEHYEAHHGVTYERQQVELCVRLAAQYMSGKFFPDKAFDVMDEAGSLARQETPPVVVDDPNLAKRQKLQTKLDELEAEKTHLLRRQEFEEAAKIKTHISKVQKQLGELEPVEMPELQPISVKNQHINRIVSLITNIPETSLDRDDIERLAHLEDHLNTQVIGQNQASRVLSRAMMRSRTGLRDPKKPVGSFVFLGTTGVGKTEMAKALTKYMFGSTDSLIRLDMSEYQEKHTVSKLIGSPPGYVGFDEGGQLTEKVRRKPYSIILLDEIEKAHPHVFDTFLQILDDGHLTDSHGVCVDFKNVTIIMTSNVGTEDLRKYNARGGHRMNDVMVNALKGHFRPEFLNRIDDIVPFNDLTHQDMLKIVDIHLQNLINRAAGVGYELTINKYARDFLAKNGFDEEYGARPVLRAIQHYVEDEISHYLVLNRAQAIKTITFDIIEIDGNDYRTIIKHS